MNGEENLKNYELDDMDDCQDQDEVEKCDISDIVVYSRDWTVDTMLKQIECGNIDLNPKFQRRNAWNEFKRNKLMDSVVKGYPIPEIVLAERKEKKNTFVVIDGKQRLLTIAGYRYPDKYNYWETPKFKTNVEKTNMSISYEDMQQYPDLLRAFENMSLRCTVITNYKDEDVLYDIFYRLNSGSAPLTTQELRQALIRGDFSDFLIDETEKPNIVRKVMKLEGPDRRLNDVAVLLRLISFIKDAKEYNGKLKNFLDVCMRKYNKVWNDESEDIKNVVKSILQTIEMLKSFFGSYDDIGRKYVEDKIEKRFNRVILEVEIYYFYHLIGKSYTEAQKEHFKRGFRDLCNNDLSFRSSIEGSTKNIENYKIRYKKFQALVNETLGESLAVCPF
jgi:hypothetical protein